jgi:membrane protein
MRMNPKAIFNVLKDTFKDWSDDKATRLGAALSYYTLFSLGPFLVVVIAIASIFYANARDQIVGTIGGIVGGDAERTIVQTMDNANKSGANIVATIIGLVTLLLGAGGVFGQLKDALNTIWEVEPKPGAGIMATIKERFLSFTMVLGTGFLLMVSLVVSAGVAALGNLLKKILPGGDIVANGVNFLMTIIIVTVMFALLFKYLPDVKIAWKDVWLGAVFTAVLFILGQIALTVYLGSGAVGKSFGAVSSVIIVLVWVYYSAQIFFFGAEFTQVYTNKYGSRVVPAENAQFATEEARAQQGISDTKESKKPERKERSRTPSLSGRLASPWFKF